MPKQLNVVNWRKFPMRVSFLSVFSAKLQCSIQVYCEEFPWCLVVCIDLKNWTPEPCVKMPRGWVSHNSCRDDPIFLIWQSKQVSGHDWCLDIGCTCNEMLTLLVLILFRNLLSLHLEQPERLYVWVLPQQGILLYKAISTSVFLYVWCTAPPTDNQKKKQDHPKNNKKAPPPKKNIIWNTINQPLFYLQATHPWSDVSSTKKKTQKHGSRFSYLIVPRSLHQLKLQVNNLAWLTIFFGSLLMFGVKNLRGMG